ncbi:RluA family pseudouridine synthase [Brevibacterium jeotgali]|uniref:Pseudouridine synthase n=1 Tax=Brevibacterium jeotgali TaxID=1262550 RepID=A0A2H1L6R8_9MICO|nr:RluA family pseudouridine synthase [Brevibacterium jeotgali]TWC02662.1 ribosomal large subunit pseudouridine synthase D [Brevibacterium jeotgali]SMY12572.1 ribosomal large subunit pseudouridine synthase D [Brevibacterium jeotgali]
MTTRSLFVPEGLDGERIDTALSRALGLSRSVAAQIAQDGGVEQDGLRVGKSDRALSGARLDVVLPEPERPLEIVAEPVPGMSIIHEDDAMVVVDKPVGVAAHAAAGWHGPTVIGGLAAAGHRVATSGAAERQGIVQRLDVGTSGVMVVAKGERAYSVLKRAFKERTVSKTYHALVQGLPDPVVGTIEAPIGRNPRRDGLYAVRSDGKHAVTHYKVLEAFRSASLVEVDLETGRTHQIRVHMSATKHPCCGDLPYGADPALAERLGLTRQWLHAMRLGIEHPETGEWMEFESQYPQDLREALDTLEAAQG